MKKESDVLKAAKDLRKDAKLLLEKTRQLFLDFEMIHIKIKMERHGGNIHGLR